jgi:hypothetical protein
MVSEKLPRFVEAGEIPVRTGVGFIRMTELAADLEASAELVAMMVMELGVGSAEGAMNLPEESIVPSEEEPPEVPLTDHVTAVLVVPETLAENETVLPARTLAEVGETVTATSGVAGGWVLLELVAEPQPARVQESKSSLAQR